MKKINNFENLYSVSKTLQFSLIPIGKTEENFIKKGMLIEDEERANNYTKIKEIMDNYYRQFIEQILANFHFSFSDFSIKDYYELYNKKDRVESDNKQMEKIEESFRKQISDALKNAPVYSKLLKKELIRELLPEYVTDSNEKNVLNQFYDFTTYFTGFWQNRENMFTAEKKSTGIAYRCINDNLPRFLYNIKVFEKIKNVIIDDINQLNSDMKELYQFETADLFSLDFFEQVLTQTGIEMYNTYIGAYSNTDGPKIKGLNEYINLYNQQVAKKDKHMRIPKFVPLYKQILSKKDSISYIPETFNSDNELLSFINQFVNDTHRTIENINKLFTSLNGFDQDGIFISTKGGTITDISNAVYGRWSAISDNWYEEYRTLNPIKKKAIDKYEEEMRTAYKKIGSFSLNEIDKYGGEEKVVSYFIGRISDLINDINVKYSAAEQLLNGKYPENKELRTDEKSISLIKELLDSYKELEHVLKYFIGTEKEFDRDMIFYGQFTPIYEEIRLLDKLYDRVRNYVTQKPYSKGKIKLNFQNPQFLGGWDKNKERDYRSIILRKDSDYFLAIMNKNDSKVFSDENITEHKCGECYQKMNYKLLPGPNKMLPKVFFAQSNIDYYSPSKEILEIRKAESFKKGKDFNIADCHKFIDFFKSSIEKHPEWRNFGFHFTPTKDYEDISQFYREVEKQGFSITYSDVSKEYIDSLINEGKVFLFQIYNKDFSPYSHGTPNMHTLYFRALFAEDNLKDVVYKLNGEAEMFYRKASIKKHSKPTHEANTPIKNKNPDNPRKESVFTYDLIKDRRFTERQFSFHLPITLNFKSQGCERINDLVRETLRSSGNNYVIGIDRGERNLLYICVIDDNGKIVYQRSLNDIIYKSKDFEYKVDYQKMLDKREKERDDARKNWKSIENIKELKEGYLSAVINEICKLVVRYDAIVVMENLNFGFKNSRIKVEKQVYQKFENMLISKLNYLVDKQLPHNEKGGLLHAYQLTNKQNGRDNSVQNGFVFYIPAYLTSKIDPTTGFVNLIYPRYTSKEKSIDFFNRFDDIYFSATDNMFAFDINYDSFERTSTSFRKKWTIWSNGERIRTFRNSAKNSEWDNEVINLTESYKMLFDKYKIDYSNELKKKIVSQTGKDFFKELIELFALTLQMRNSKTGIVDEDYMISPIKNSNGTFYNSKDYSGETAELPTCADANGAYNIARKGQMAIKRIQEASEEEYKKVNIAIKNEEWLKYAQKKDE